MGQWRARTCESEHGCAVEGLGAQAQIPEAHAPLPQGHGCAIGVEVGNEASELAQQRFEGPLRQHARSCPAHVLSEDATCHSGHFDYKKKTWLIQERGDESLCVEPTWGGACHGREVRRGIPLNARFLKQMTDKGPIERRPHDYSCALRGCSLSELLA